MNKTSSASQVSISNAVAASEMLQFSFKILSFKESLRNRLVLIFVFFIKLLARLYFTSGKALGQVYNTVYMKSLELDFSQKINAMTKFSLVSKLIYLQIQFKVFHWQTYSFSNHNAFGALYGSLSDKIDQFVETFQGIYGRIDFQGEIFALDNLNSMNFQEILDDQTSALKTYESYFSDTDLLNIRDEILGSLHQTRYLLTLM